MSVHFNPITGKERIGVLDCLRALALFGILAVNMNYFSQPVIGLFAGAIEVPSSDTLNHLADNLIKIVFAGKFITMFSFMFGVGIAVQMERSQRKGNGFAGFFFRRMLILLGFGLMHGVLLWTGDVLTTYAILGFVLIPFLKCKPRTLLIWAFICFLVPIGMTAVNIAETQYAAVSEEMVVKREIDAIKEEQRLNALYQDALKVYADDDIVAMIKIRISELPTMYEAIVIYGWLMLVFIFLGMWAWRAGAFKAMETKIPFYKRLMWIGFCIAIPGNIYVQLNNPALPGAEPQLSIVTHLIYSTTVAAQCIAYMCALTLLYQGRAHRLLVKLNPMGRMGLSNYLLQSLVFTTVFYGYGLGLLTHVGYALGLLLTVSFIPVQVFVSTLWLRHFRYGPIEWLWRVLAYARLQPIKQRRESPTETPAGEVN